MSEQAPAPKAKRKAQGPRQQKPMFIVIGYTDESGQPVKLDRSRLVITATKDPTELLAAFEADPNLAYATVEIPSAKANPTAAA